jgi:excisionase family DNA binding protein
MEVMALTIKELDYIADRVAENVLSRMKMADELLTTTDVARMLEVTPQAVTTMVRDGKIRGYRQGHRYFFSKNELLKSILR